MEPGWTVTLTVQVAWGEMDAFGHVNNTVYLRWFESARIGYFEKLGLTTAATGSHHAAAWPILARSAIDYRSPVVYPDQIEVSARVTRLGNTSFSMAYRAHSKQQNKVVAEGEAVVVMIDPRSGSKVALDATLRARLTELEGI